MFYDVLLRSSPAKTKGTAMSTAFLHSIWDGALFENISYNMLQRFLQAPQESIWPLSSRSTLPKTPPRLGMHELDHFLFNYLSISLSSDAAMRLLTYLTWPTYLSIHLSISIYVSIHPSIYPSIGPPFVDRSVDL